MFPTKDYMKFATAICNFIEERESFKEMENRPGCVGKTIGRREGEWKRMPISISGCTPGVVEEMPHIKFKFDQYNFDLRPKKYMDYMRVESMHTRMVDYNEDHPTGICSLNIYPSTLATGAVIGTPFLDDYYQVYDQERSQIGLVPSIFTNPYNDDGRFTSSPVENVHAKKD
jgi:hypothetical protein